MGKRYVPILSEALWSDLNQISKVKKEVFKIWKFYRIYNFLVSEEWILFVDISKIHFLLNPQSPCVISILRNRPKFIFYCLRTLGNL